ncbi:MAG: hypothetical protein EOO41_00225, partial [Methanobacteriota archaeon]
MYAILALTSLAECAVTQAATAETSAVVPSACSATPLLFLRALNTASGAQPALELAQTLLRVAEAATDDALWPALCAALAAALQQTWDAHAPAWVLANVERVEQHLLDTISKELAAASLTSARLSLHLSLLHALASVVAPHAVETCEESAVQPSIHAAALQAVATRALRTLCDLALPTNIAPTPALAWLALPSVDVLRGTAAILTRARDANVSSLAFRDAHTLRVVVSMDHALAAVNAACTLAAMAVAVQRGVDAARPRGARHMHAPAVSHPLTTLTLPLLLDAAREGVASVAFEAVSELLSASAAEIMALKRTVAEATEPHAVAYASASVQSVFSAVATLPLLPQGQLHMTMRTGAQAQAPTASLDALIASALDMPDTEKAENLCLRSDMWGASAAAHAYGAPPDTAHSVAAGEGGRRASAGHAVDVAALAPMQRLTSATSTRVGSLWMTTLESVGSAAQHFLPEAVAADAASSSTARSGCSDEEADEADARHAEPHAPSFLASLMHDTDTVASVAHYMRTSAVPALCESIRVAAQAGDAHEELHASDPHASITASHQWHELIAASGLGDGVADFSAALVPDCAARTEVHVLARMLRYVATTGKGDADLEAVMLARAAQLVRQDASIMDASTASGAVLCASIASSLVYMAPRWQRLDSVTSAALADDVRLLMHALSSRAQVAATCMVAQPALGSILLPSLYHSRSLEETTYAHAETTSSAPARLCQPDRFTLLRWLLIDVPVYPTSAQRLQCLVDALPPTSSSADAQATDVLCALHVAVYLVSFTLDASEVYDYWTAFAAGTSFVDVQAGRTLDFSLQQLAPLVAQQEDAIRTALGAAQVHGDNAHRVVPHPTDADSMALSANVSRLVQYVARVAERDAHDSDTSATVRQVQRVCAQLQEPAHGAAASPPAVSSCMQADAHQLLAALVDASSGADVAQRAFADRACVSAGMLTALVVGGAALLGSAEESAVLTLVNSLLARAIGSSVHVSHASGLPGVPTATVGGHFFEGFLKLVDCAPAGSFHDGHLVPESVRSVLVTECARHGGPATAIEFAVQSANCAPVRFATFMTAARIFLRSIDPMRAAREDASVGAHVADDLRLSDVAPLLLASQMGAMPSRTLQAVEDDVLLHGALLLPTAATLHALSYLVCTVADGVDASAADAQSCVATRLRAFTAAWHQMASLHATPTHEAPADVSQLALWIALHATTQASQWWRGQPHANTFLACLVQSMSTHDVCVSVAATAVHPGDAASRAALAVPTTVCGAHLSETTTLQACVALLRAAHDVLLGSAAAHELVTLSALHMVVYAASARQLDVNPHCPTHNLLVHMLAREVFALCTDDTLPTPVAARAAMLAHSTALCKRLATHVNASLESWDARPRAAGSVRDVSGELSLVDTALCTAAVRGMETVAENSLATASSVSVASS